MFRFPKNSKSALFSSRLSACPTQCFESQVGTLQWSEQHNFQGVSFARKRLATQICTHMSNRRGRCILLINLCLTFFSVFYSFGFFSSDILLLRRSIVNRMKFHNKREASPLYRRALLRYNCVRSRLCILGKTSQRNKQ